VKGESGVTSRVPRSAVSGPFTQASLRSAWAGPPSSGDRPCGPYK